MSDARLGDRLARRILHRVVAAAARRTLADRELVGEDGARRRWLTPEIERCVAAFEPEAVRLRPYARSAALPRFGNRLLVEMAVQTVAAYRTLRQAGVAAPSARATVADLGWVVYRRMVAATALPARVATRDPGRRLRWTVRMLLFFPFSAEGAPGYAVERRIDGDDILTHFTHCPPQTFARRLGETFDDPEILAVFRQSWCQYDWPVADVIAKDGRRGHYARRRTLSYGDAVCDMCWRAHATGDARHGPPETTKKRMRRAGAKPIAARRRDR
ncbi:L-2-amino-thiazoline-4-carboxylic acid hydrolase [Aquibium sp. A9E412]|uniref:hypothetical protein n=1 Tax=Aquibium sp. A9E412 TaxID=2976767 RepID=UPI0025B24D6D|nr:hypothetical protein [Aquibium sp. A9E412]MDN2567853.1 L-2-amino-thiazoline-4-carboxylic acid hydrolase [Aquibium sp. A9E412]